MKKRYPIEIVEMEGMHIFYPIEIAPNLKLNRIVFGSCSIDAHCHPHLDRGQKITISSNAAHALKIPKIPVPLHVFPNDHNLFLGPLVGIFTSGFTNFALRPLGERTAFFAKLLSVNKTVGAHVFLFGEEHINWEDGTIKGLFYDQGKWDNIEVPFPNVIYDRLPNRRSEKKTQANQIKERLQLEYLIPWYNPGFFNKLDVYERLLQNDKAVKYLPETHPFTSFSIIERMLADYGHVFVKPFNGSLGLGVHQLIYDKDAGNYYCRYRDKDGLNRLRKFSSLESLFSNVFHKRSLSKMLVQQGIHSIKIDKRTVDFRVHTNKNIQGKWVVTAIAAKVAGPGSVTTHVNNGGEIRTIHELFEEKEEQNRIIEKLKTTCLELSSILEEQMEGIVGEIGFDLGIDRQGDVWLFEANSKPGRSIFKHPQLKSYELLTRKLSLAFSVFLTEMAIFRPEEIFK